ncbi:MAG: dihydroxyacetone kinase subunit DhaK [Actinobacteria bacterium]|nr:dihydroxyacetone kinase subunit DhaK [Actinomycetota bacterium]
MKKLINNPTKVVDELLEGFAFANAKTIKRIDNYPVFARIDAPIKNKVGIVIGGGAGHEPLFLEYIGKGMADVEVHGRIFAAPSPDYILEATRAANGGAGVIFLYNNYAGDRLNFDIAQDLARSEGIKVDTILIYDDIASGNKGREKERRGTAADLVVIKIAGAVSESMKPFEEVKRVVEKARDNSRSIGVSLSSCTLPETGKQTFDLEFDKIEFGMGLHGEAGIKRMDMQTADEIVSIMVPLLIEDLPFKKGDEIIVTINGYGATTRMELFIVYRKAHAMLMDYGITVFAAEIGEFCTTQEMAGCSITFTKIDDELKKYYQMPCISPFYKKLA